MLTTLQILLIILIGLYIMTLGYLSRGLRPLQYHKNDNRSLPTVTVIVSARNEAHQLDLFFNCLKQQNYPHELLEFCIVDDRSSDATFARIEAFARACPMVKALRITDTVPHLAPKKRAIDLAIRRSRGEILLLTDADTQPGPNWVRRFASHFTDEVAMICGYSPYHPRKNLWQKVLALEYFSHAAVSAAGIGAGMALTCTGSNLAYRRRAYYAIGGFEKIASFISGDDDLLLHEMHRRRIGKILYLPDPAAAAPTQPPASWREFFWQRIRFASKGRHYRPLFTAGLVAIYAMNLMLGSGMLVSLALGKFLWLCAIVGLWATKALAEFLFLRRAAEVFMEQPLLNYFPIASLLHPFYAILFGGLGQFLSFQWKGERFDRRLTTAQFVKAVQ